MKHSELPLLTRGDPSDKNNQVCKKKHYTFFNGSMNCAMMVSNSVLISLSSRKINQFYCGNLLKNVAEIRKKPRLS